MSEQASPSRERTGPQKRDATTALVKAAAWFHRDMPAETRRKLVAIKRRVNR